MRFFTKKNILLGIIGAIIILAPIWIWVLGPKFTALPNHFSYSADIISVDNLYDEAKAEFSGEIFSVTKFSYETIAHSKKGLLIKNIFDVKKPTGEPIFSVERQYGVQPVTHAHVKGLGDKNREGYLFAPRNLKQGQSFTYWHINYDAPANMKYVDEETVYGLKVYKYETHYEGVKVDQTKELSYLPGVPEERGVVLDPYLQIWVEPVTGMLVKYKDQTTAYYYNIKTGEKINPWNTFSNVFSEESVYQRSAIIRSQKNTTIIVERFIPIMMGLMLIILIISLLDLKENLRKYMRYVHYEKCVGALTMGVGIVALCAVIFHFEDRINVFSSPQAVNPVAAISIIIVGLGVFLHNVQKGIWTFIFGCILLMIGGVKLLGFYDLISFQIDAIGQTPMPFFAAISLIGIGSTFLTLKSKKARDIRIPQIFSGIGVALCGIGVIGYIMQGAYVLKLPLFFSLSFAGASMFFLNALTLFFIGKPEKKLKINFFSKFIFFTCLSSVLIITVFFTSYIENSLYSRSQAVFENETQNIEQNLKKRMEIYTNSVNGGVALFNASQSVTRAEWREYAGDIGIKENYAGVQGMAYVQLLTDAEKEGHIQSVRAEGFPEYEIFPPGNREQYAVITYIEPFEGRNLKAFGYDALSDPARRHAMELARDTGNTTLTSKIKLIQDSDDDFQPGFLMLRAIYDKNMPQDSVEARRLAIQGYISSPFRAKDFMEGFLDNEVQNMDIHLYDGLEISNENLLYDFDHDDGNFPENTVFTKAKTVYILGHPWILKFNSTDEFISNVDSIIPLGILTFGMMITILIAGIFYTSLASRDKAVAYAEEMNKDMKRKREELVQLNQDLEREIKENKETQKTLEEKTMALEDINRIMVGRELKMIEMKRQMKKDKLEPKKKSKVRKKT